MTGTAAALSLALLCCTLLGVVAIQLPPGDSEEAILLAFKASIDNWEDVYTSRGMQGWSSCAQQPKGCVSLCRWTGVHCDVFSSTTGERVTSLELPCGDGCTVRAAGRLPPELGRLQYLSVLCLEGNSFFGQLPPEWGLDRAFPNLYLMSLSSNTLTGGLPGEWASGGAALPALRELHLAGNRLSGSLGAWADSAGTGALQALQVLSLANNELSGTLPENLAGLGSLVTLALQDNKLAGALPAGWGLPGQGPGSNLTELFCHNNLLTGQLPAEWASAGAFLALRTLTLGANPLATATLPAAWGAPGAWPALQELNISHAGLQGTLPEAWGQGMRSLQTLVLDGNDLQGTVPDSWAGLPSLSKVYLLPENPSICTQAPNGAQFRLCSCDDPLCSVGLAAADSAPGACAAGAGGSSSGVPVAAIIAPVVAAVVVVAAAAGAVVLVRRRRQQRMLGAQGAGGKLPGRPSLGALPTGGAGGGLGGGYPSTDYIFHAEEGSVWDGKLGGGPPAISVHKVPSSELMAPSTATSTAQPAAAQEKPVRPSLDCSISGCLPCAAKPVPGDEVSISSHNLSSGGAGAGSGAPLCPRPPPAPRSQHSSGASGASTRTSGPGLPASASRGSLQERQRSGSGEVGGTRGGTATTGVGSGSGARSGSGDASWRHSLDVEINLPSCDISPEEIEIMKRPDGSNWELGAGGFGRVYKAMRNGVTPVAVKVLSSSEELRSRASEEDFWQEICLLGACRDSNIVQFQGVCIGRPEGVMLVTEYMEGGNLLNNIRLGKVSWYKRGKRVAIEVARGLAYLHSKRLIHFDVKSSNILLTKDGAAKLADVGMSKYMAKDYITGAVGTLAWSAPEMLWGTKCTTKSDIYSFGIVLWEIVSGEQPVRGQLRDVSVPEECPEEVRDIILCCLEPNPAERPTAVQLVEWLQHAPAMPPSKSAPALPGRPSPTEQELAAMPCATSAPPPADSTHQLHGSHGSRSGSGEHHHHHHQQQQQQQQEPQGAASSGHGLPEGMVVEALRISEDHQHEISALRSRVFQERVRQQQQERTHQAEVAALQGRVAQLEAAAAVQQQRHAGEMAGLQGRLAELEEVTRTALRASMDVGYTGGARSGPSAPSQGPSREASIPEEGAVPPAAAGLAPEFGSQHRQALAAAQSLSLASPFAAFFAQQPDGWDSSEDEEEEGAEGAGAEQQKGAGPAAGRGAPARLVNVHATRQRTASGLLPVQDGLSTAAAGISRASSQLPAPVGQHG